MIDIFRENRFSFYQNPNLNHMPKLIVIRPE